MNNTKSNILIALLFLLIIFLGVLSDQIKINHDNQQAHQIQVAHDLVVKCSDEVFIVNKNTKNATKMTFKDSYDIEYTIYVISQSKVIKNKCKLEVVK